MEFVAGRGPAPRFVFSVVAGLPLGSSFVSMVLADKRGGDWREYLGKTHEWYALADLIDTLNLNTAATGNWKRKPPSFDPYKRPGADVPAGQNRKTKASSLAGPNADKAALLDAIFNNLGGAGAR